MTRGAPVILFALDRDGVVTFSEGKALALVGEKPGDAVGRSVFEDYAHLPAVAETVRRALSGEEVVETVEIERLAFEVRVVDQSWEMREVVAVQKEQQANLVHPIRFGERETLPDKA